LAKARDVYVTINPSRNGNAGNFDGPRVGPGARFNVVPAARGDDHSIGYRNGVDHPFCIVLGNELANEYRFRPVSG
jgi:hypothetical protein